jgi:hypothetical protein
VTAQQREQGRLFRQRTAKDAYAGRPRPMTTSDPAELGRALRLSMWRFSSRTNTRDPDQRDRQALALARQQHRAASDLFPDVAILATLREVNAGCCSWCACRALAAASGEPAPTPNPGLRGLLGTPCRTCQGVFAARRVAARERASLAAASSQPPRAAPVPQAATRKPALPPFYGSKRLQPRR